MACAARRGSSSKAGGRLECHRSAGHRGLRGATGLPVAFQVPPFTAYPRLRDRASGAEHRPDFLAFVQVTGSTRCPQGCDQLEGGLAPTARRTRRG